LNTLLVRLTQPLGAKVRLTDAQVRELRGLTQLMYLDCTVSEAALLTMLEPPFSRQLQWIELPGWCLITDAVAEQLPQLPCLLRVNTARTALAVSNLNFLAQLLR
jgi:hypothetical protein